MKNGRGILDHFSDNMDLPGESFSGQPIVEVLGERQVLIENHLGVMEYSRERIGVNVKYGQIIVCGCGLELRRMSFEQLVISGRIDAVSLIRRSKE